jgi:hypothetical protein
MFPTTFSWMKGIVGELGEMKIPLKTHDNPVKHRPYRLNLMYKKKVKVEDRQDVGSMELLNLS